MSERMPVTLKMDAWQEYCKDNPRACDWFIEGDKLTTNGARRDGCIEVSNGWLSEFVPRRFVHVVEIVKP
jgi:hypothetical protein